ncbi:TonB-dependent receptor [Asticcacaulis solisilvae]|uniref:TonB-dependent receptor n=1 Tax=Asticcacaulis solisilvae TaxID=1217274 RepID=UPI003FD87862
MKTSRKAFLLAATGLVAAMACAPALAEDKPADTKSAETKVENGQEVVIVRGVRGSVKDSADKKRRNKQISDSVSAEDAGKLPDNNVTEALAHVTGVQITRQHGEGQDMAIRGIQEVGTTINGNAVGGGAMRSMNHNGGAFEDGNTCDSAQITGACNAQGPTLSDIPAALIKSVTVYKTRTADQVEGGVAGVVNVELRRPLDLPKGFTAAGSYRMSYSNLGDKESPYASVLLADRFDTPIGEMGWLANFGYERNNYQETHLATETTQYFYSSGYFNGNTADVACLHRADTWCGTAKTPYYVTAYRVWNGIQDGVKSRPTANFGFQWKPNENLDFVLESTYLGSDEKAENDYISVKTSGDWNPNYAITTFADGATVKTETVTPGDWDPTGNNSVYNELISGYWHNTSKTFTNNFEMHYHKDRVQLNGSIQYNTTEVLSTNIYQDIKVLGLNTAIVNFDGPGDRATVTFPQASVATDPANYRMYNFHNEQNNSTSRDLNGQLDLTYTVSDTFPIRSLQAGYRLTSHFSNSFNGYRDAFTNAALSAWPTGSSLDYTKLPAGFSIPGFYHLSNTALLSHWSDVITYLSGSQGSLWATDVPTDRDSNSNAETEFSNTWYGQFNYAFKAYFPIDGVIGVRVAATKGTAHANSFRDAHTTTVNGVTTTVPASVVNDDVEGHYRDIMPSYNATVHLNDKTLLRLAYTYSIQRPAFSAMSGTAHIYYDATGKAASGWGGNPNLKPMKGPNYDASLEYYFGRGGVVSLAAYLKEPDGSFYWKNNELRSFPELGVDTPIPYGETLNAGRGVYQGYEFNAQGFFDFLPGVWHNFGGAVNFTYNQIFKIEYPDASTLSDQGFAPLAGNMAPYTSKNTYNIQLYYDTPKFNARIAYNYRSKYYGQVSYGLAQYTPVFDATSRLDASLAWTPVKQWTFTLEGSNLLNNNELAYYGQKYYPAETRLQGRTIQVGARFRY